MFNMMEQQVGTSLAYFNDETGISIWWNGSATFNVWQDGVEIDVFTRYGAALDNYSSFADEWLEDEETV